MPLRAALLSPFSDSKVHFMAADHPRITISHHVDHGVVAVASQDNPVIEHMLRRVSFERVPHSDLYALTDPQYEPVRRAAQAVQSLRAAKYDVTAEAAYDLHPWSRAPARRPSADRPAEASLHDLGSRPLPQEQLARAACFTSPARSRTSALRHPAATADVAPAREVAAPERQRVR